MQRAFDAVLARIFPLLWAGTASLIVLRYFGFAFLSGGMAISGHLSACIQASRDQDIAECGRAVNDAIQPGTPAARYTR